MSKPGAGNAGFLRSLAVCLRTARDLDELDVAYCFSAAVVEVVSQGVPEPRFRGMLPRMAVFLKRVLLRASARTEALAPSDVLFFASSINQYMSLQGMRQQLSELGTEPAFLVSQPVLELAREPLQASPIRATYSDACASLLIALVFLPRLLLRLRKFPGLARSFLDQFLEVYRLLPTFLRHLRQLQPRVLVVANDHTTSCRLLTQIARDSGVKTLYLQHAQVGGFFPPLDHSYVFLDGEAALQAYSAIAKQTGARSANTQIFLNGEKKTPPRQHPSGTSELRCVGIAVSPADEPDKIGLIAASIARNSGLGTVIRPHPGSPASLMTELERCCASLPRTRIVPAAEQPVSDFLDGIRFLVAGDSSIHLDALLRGVPTFYAVLHSQAVLEDYYGFVGQGLVPTLPGEVTDWELLTRDYRIPTSALRRYSATYSTTWQGRESQLAALTLKALINSDLGTLDRLYPNRLDGRQLCFGIQSVRAVA